MMMTASDFIKRLGVGNTASRCVKNTVPACRPVAADPEGQGD